MRVIFSGGTADLSAIQSVSVGESDGKFKILVRHKTKRTEKVSSINFRRKIYDNPEVEMTTEFAEEIVKDIENLTQNPDMPIEQVIELKVWATGYLQVNLKTTTDAQATIALARLRWGWIFGVRKVPTDKQLELRTGLDTHTITCLASRDDYKAYVADIMGNALHGEGCTREEFRAWVKGCENMPERFGDQLKFVLCVEFIGKDLNEQYIYQHMIAILKDKNIESEVLWSDISTDDRLIVLYSVKIQKDPNPDDGHFVEYFGEDIIPEDEIFEVIDRSKAYLCIWTGNKPYYTWRYIVDFLEDEIIEAEVYWYNDPTNRRPIPKKPYELLIS